MATQKHPAVIAITLGNAYFFVPHGANKASLFLKAIGPIPGRGARVTVYSPDSRVAASFSGDLTTLSEMPIGFPKHFQGRTWRISVVDATSELVLYFSDEVSGILSWNPEATIAFEGPPKRN